MKISKRRLKRIIREEKEKLQELDFSGPAVGTDDELAIESISNELYLEGIKGNLQEIAAMIWNRLKSEGFC